MKAYLLKRWFGVFRAAFPTILIACLVSRPACGQSILDALKGAGIDLGSNAVHTVGSRISSRLVDSILPADREELAKGNVLILQDGSWKQATTNSQAVPKQYLVRSSTSAAAQPRTLSRGPIVLEEKVVQGKVPGRLALEVHQSPLPWNSQTHAYSTRLEIGLQADGAKNPKLDVPITINLTGNNAAISPASLKIVQLGQQGFVSATITCSRHDTEPQVTLHSDWGERSFEVPIVPHNSKLGLSISETKIFGFGLGTAQLTIKRFAEDGRELSDSNSLVVNVSADHGKTDSSAVTIPAGQSHAEVTLRSVGLGAAQVSAEIDSLKAELPAVQFTFPFAYVLAAIGGGCLGGLGRFCKDNKAAPKRKSKADEKRTAKSPVRYLAEGCLVGFLIVAAVAAGLVLTRLPTTVIATELGALVIGTVGGFSGAPVLDWLKSGISPLKIPRRVLTRG
jgi:hypothetical protein